VAEVFPDDAAARVTEDVADKQNVHGNRVQGAGGRVQTGIAGYGLRVRKWPATSSQRSAKTQFGM
jgi:hypothetical protein